MDRYGFLPELTADEFARLKASIAERGVEVPVVRDERGDLLDGRARVRASKELGLPCPSEVRSFASEADKFECILTANVCRRKQLNRDQKRTVVQAYLLRDSEIADNLLADLIGGISHNTVRAIRLQMISKGDIPRHEKLRGKDNKHRPAKIKRVIASTERDVDEAINAIKNVPDGSAGRILDVVTAGRHARREQRRQIRKGLARKAGPGDPFDDIAIYHCPFQQLEVAAGLVPGSSGLLLTDIPYDESFVKSGQIADLAQLAKRLLKPGGVFVTYCGVMQHVRVATELAKYLDPYWTAISRWSGAGVIVRKLNVANHYKVVLVFTKGAFLPRFCWNDDISCDDKAKTWHDWQQSLGEAEKLIEIFSRPGDLCCDPCGGGFTVALACQKLGRRCVSCDISEECVKLGRVRLQEEAVWEQQWVHPFVIPLVRPFTAEEPGIAAVRA